MTRGSRIIAVAATEKQTSGTSFVFERIPANLAPVDKNNEIDQVEPCLPTAHLDFVSLAHEGKGNQPEPPIPSSSSSLLFFYDRIK